MKFKVNVTYSLSTEVEPDGNLYGVETVSDEIEEYDESSYWSGESVHIQGGEVSFVLEAEDEDEARERAVQLVEAGSFDSNDNSEWEINDVEVEGIEQVEEELALGTAIIVVVALLKRLTENGQISDEEHRALTLVFEEILKAPVEPV